MCGNIRINSLKPHIAFILFGTNRQLPPASHVTIAVPRVPSWATPRGRVEVPVEAAFMAGSAMKALDNPVQAEPGWNGAPRRRRFGGRAQFIFTPAQSVSSTKGTGRHVVPYKNRLPFDFSLKEDCEGIFILIRQQNSRSSANDRFLKGRSC